MHQTARHKRRAVCLVAQTLEVNLPYGRKCLLYSLIVNYF